MITTKNPESWQSLQDEVGRILEECGFAVDVTKTLEMPRGKVEVDVYAEELIRGRKNIIVCECKYWKNKIPQSVIHGFRTVIQEAGANVGYVVSLEGFQSGSYAANEFTNIQLVTWAQFQDAFLESWYENFFTKEVDEKLDSIMTYAEPFLPSWFEKMSTKDKSRYIELREKYETFGVIMQSLGPYSRLLTKAPIPTLPLREKLSSICDLGTVPSHILDEHGYRELLDSAIAYSDEALIEFHALRDHYSNIRRANES